MSIVLLGFRSIRKWQKVLRGYRNQQQELVDILYSSLDYADLKKEAYSEDDERNPISRTDPLTFMGCFNGGLTFWG